MNSNKAALKFLGLILVLISLTGCVFRHSSEIMIVQHKADAIQKVFLSSDNRLCIVATNCYLVIDLNKQFGENPPKLRWKDFLPGSPPLNLMREFSEIPLVKDFSYVTYLSLQNNTHETQRTNRNVLYYYREVAGYRDESLEFEFFSTERTFKGSSKRRFLIEEPVRFERVYAPLIDG
jgi:hypothetical protein